MMAHGGACPKEKKMHWFGTMSHGCMQGQLNLIDAEKANTVMIVRSV
jgi:hypothetical protein